MSDQAELFIVIGQALYGQQWKGEMARSRNVRDSTVNEWAAGKGAAIPAGVWDELRAELDARRKHIADLLPRIPK